jgi:hypothetical protein
MLTFIGGIFMKSFLQLFVAILLISGLTAQAFPPVIDGQRDAWHATLTSNKEGFLYLPPESCFPGMEEFTEDASDCSALCWIGWDETYLYAYLEITDELVQVNNATSYLNDGVEFKMDPDPTTEEPSGGGVAAIRLTAFGEDKADEPLGVDNLVGGGELDNLTWEPQAGTDYARTENDTGYTLEWRIPFDAIQRIHHVTQEVKIVNVAVGEPLGFAVSILDNDDIQSDAYLNWSAGHVDATWNDCSLLGTAYFLADHKFRLENVNYYSGEDPASDSTMYQAPAWYLSVDPILDNNLPMEFELSQNYPNPFNPTTTIPFSLNKTEQITLAVYDVSGKLITTLINDQSYAQGKYTASWNGMDNSGAMAASGIYLYQLKAGNRIESRKMLLVK